MWFEELLGKNAFLLIIDHKQRIPPERFPSLIIFTTMRRSLPQISVFVYVLAMLYGISAWIEISGVFTQMPLMVPQLPEYWDLLSYVGLIYNVGNVGLIFYAVYHRLATKPKESLVMYLTITFGSVCCLLMVFFWKNTVVIGGKSHSLPLFILVAGLSMVDATSSVVYLTYIGGFKPQYMSGYYVGEGLSGLIPSLISLIQGGSHDPVCVNESNVVYDNETGLSHTEYVIKSIDFPPRISVEAVLLVLMGMMCVSGIAFALLNHLPNCQRERIDWNEIKSTKTVDIDTCSSTNKSCSTNSPTSNENSVSTEEIVVFSVEGTPVCGEWETVPSEKHMSNNASIDKEGLGNTSESQNSRTENSTKQLTTIEHFVLQLMILWISFWYYGVNLAIVSYTCLPYGNLAFSLSIYLGLLAVPLVYFVSLFKVIKSLMVLGGLSIVGTVLICFQLYLAFRSPNPPLQYEASGKAIVVGFVSLVFDSHPFACLESLQIN